MSVCVCVCVCVFVISKNENEKPAQMQHHNRLYGNSIMKEFVPMVISTSNLKGIKESVRTSYLTSLGFVSTKQLHMAVLLLLL